MSTLPEPATVRAAGGAVWRRGTGGQLETALVHRPKYDDWSLPKGKPDAGEHPLQTAVREVVEETGLSVVAGRRSVRTRYEVGLRDGRMAPKEVEYWLMQGTGEFVPNDEVDQLRWLGLDDAGALCSHEHDRAVLADLGRTDLPRAPALLLVRHASAGDRSDFDGPDERRPLDRRGRAQAQRLAEVLPLFCPVDLRSAPPTRCWQTMAPLASRQGLDVQPVPELGEEAYGDDPAAGLAVVEKLLAEGAGQAGPAVVCSQGGAIPSVLLALGVRWHTSAGTLWPPSAKGSVWALAGHPGALSADYYRQFSADPAG